MTTNRTNAIAGRRRPILGWIAAIWAVVLLVGACASSSTVDLASLGLDIDTDIQAGSQFEVAVPIQSGTTITVASAPPGVTASISETAGGESILLSVAVDAGTPRGAYRLALFVVRGEEEYQLGWPFDVVDGAATATTASGPVEGT